MVEQNGQFVVIKKVMQRIAALTSAGQTVMDVDRMCSLEYCWKRPQFQRLFDDDDSIDDSEPEHKKMATMMNVMTASREFTRCNRTDWM